MKEHNCSQKNNFDILFNSQRKTETKVNVMYGVAIVCSGLLVWFFQTLYTDLKQDLFNFNKNVNVFQREVIQIKIEAAKTSTILERLEKKIDKEIE